MRSIPVRVGAATAGRGRSIPTKTADAVSRKERSSTNCRPRANARPAKDWAAASPADGWQRASMLRGRKEGLAALEVGNLLTRQLENLVLSRPGQLLLGNFRFFRRADAPAEAEDEIPADPGGHQQPGGRGRQQAEASLVAGRGAEQCDQTRGGDHAMQGS